MQITYLISDLYSDIQKEYIKTKQEDQSFKKMGKRSEQALH